MPALQRVLRDYDLGLLRIIAAYWGVTLTAPNQREAADELTTKLLDPALVAEIIESLPPAPRAAFAALTGQHLALATFTRKYGELRVMGATRRDREQPWDNAPSAAEWLWYRGLIGRAFFDEGGGPQEFIFIPDDLLKLVPPGIRPPLAGSPLGHAFAPPAAFASALDAAPDDLATLLAYLQIAVVRLEGAHFPRKHRETLGRFLRLPEALDLWLHLAIHLGLVSGSPLKLDPAKARPFLEASRPEQVAILAPAWRDSREWNDLLHLPGLIFEGKAWSNDPYTARQSILALLQQVPASEWWSLEAFVAAVHDQQPDFQRRPGDYDAWYIRDAATQAYLRGFENWDRVDGALVRWLIEKPLYWLGLVELATPIPRPLPSSENSPTGEGESPSPVRVFSERGRAGVGVAFRLTPYAAAFFGLAPWPVAESDVAPTFHIQPNGYIRVPAAVSRYDRFQVARVTHWLPLEPQTAPLPEANYFYRLTPTSLTRAAKQGIRVSHILGFLQKSVGEDGVPPTLVGALHRWERAGVEVTVKDTLVLKLKNRDLLATLRRTPSIQRYLGETLGPEAVEVRREHLDKLREALADVGILLD